MKDTFQSIPDGVSRYALLIITSNRTALGDSDRKSTDDMFSVTKKVRTDI